MTGKTKAYAMSASWKWDVFLQNANMGDGSTYFDWLLHGLRMTLWLSLSAWVIALVLGSIVGVLRTAPIRWLSWLASAYVEVLRNIPLLVQLFVWYFVLPELLPTAWGDTIKQWPPVLQQMFAGIGCLGLFTSARVCEQVRAGILSLPEGQQRAGLALGLSLPQTYRHVLLPMAYRLIVPPLTSEFLNIFKNSAVCSTIGLLELAAQGRQLVDYTALPYESFIAVTVAYMLINVVVMVAMRWVEKKARVPGLLHND
jgi:glutamate/aspartate transport system permease protein